MEKAGVDDVAVNAVGNSCCFVFIPSGIIENIYSGGGRNNQEYLPLSLLTEPMLLIAVKTM